ncbi:MAG: hypothetical protein RLZZ371_1778, partial [Pseudomonadota bacterium]
MPDGRQNIHRQHVHGIHQEDPDKHGQCQRRHQLAAVGIVNHTLGLLVHQLSQNFNSRLKTPWHTRSGLGCRTPQNETGERTQNDRIKQGIQIEQTEVNQTSLLHTFKREIHLQVLQMVLDVFTSVRTMCSSVFSSSHMSSPINQFIKASQPIFCAPNATTWPPSTPSSSPQSQPTKP